jgi:hypothetical protein
MQFTKFLDIRHVMTKGLAEFWSQRHKAMGHTGWSNPIIYAYDQIERLAIIERTIEALDIEKDCALDFGCGKGDFSRMLLKTGFKVYGYDPYVKPNILNHNFIYINNHNQLNIFIKEPINIILSVTVLDHIMNESEFYDELAYFRTKVADNGFLLCLEYALDEDAEETNCIYQAFRTLPQWQKHLADSGWQILNVISIPHPAIAPSIGFMHYQYLPFISLIRKLAQRRYFKKLFLPILKIIAQSVFSNYGSGNVEMSPLKLIICKP